MIGSVTWASFTHRYKEMGGGEIPAVSWLEDDTAPYARLGEVDSVDGFVMAFSPWAIQNLRFDESIGTKLHGYDFDICMQARQAGKKVVTADLKVVHHHTLSLVSDAESWVEAQIKLAEKWEDVIPPAYGAELTWKERARRAEAETSVARMIGAASDLLYEARNKELQREVDTNRELYDIFFTRMKSVSETGGFEKPHARIVDRAMVPTYPVKPNKRLSVTLAFILGIMLGCGIAILLDMLDNTVKNPDEVQEKLRVPLLGTLPKMKTNKKGQFQQFWQKPQGPFAEALRTVRTGVVLSSLDKPAKIIVVTSTVPGEGKSTVALNLGAALAQMENTLVIGADLRRPSLANKCQLTPNHPGLTHFVAGTAKLEDCIEHLPELNLYVMPAGIIPPNPLEIISSKKFVQALKFLRERFDRIVIDSAPVQAVSDALILASNADSVIYVVKADATSATQAQKGIAGIVASNEPFTGVVLNMFDPKKAHGYFGYKYYNYHNYYGPTETL